MEKIFSWVCATIAVFCLASVKPSLAATDPLIQAITSASKLKFVKSVDLTNQLYPTYHPQGVKIVGQDLYLSTVQGKSTGFGYLINYKLDAPSVPNTASPFQRLTFNPGEDKKMIHAGGIDLDGANLLIPIAYYTSKGPGQLLQVNLKNFNQYKVLAKIEDHIGTVISDSDAYRLMNWDTKKIYNLDRTSGMQKSTLDGSGWNYQDCKKVVSGYALCSALKGKLIRDGEIHLISFSPDQENKIQIVHRIKVDSVNPDGTSGRGRLLTYNAMDFAPIYASGSKQITGIRFYFVPHDDDETRLLIYDSLNAN